MMFRRAVALGSAFAVGLAVAAGCSASAEDNGYGYGGGSAIASGNAQGSGGDTLFTTGVGGAGGSGLPGGDCSDAAKLVYVVGTGNELYSFAPQTLSFSKIGTLNCPVNGGPGVGTPTPFSMAVDRQGVAWVLYSDGTIFHVDVTTAACSSTAFAPNQLTAFNLFGMGFVSDAAGSNEETLYIGSFDGSGIGKIDTQTLKVSSLGFYDSLSGAAELTGTGDARLFGFFLTTPVTVAEIDTTNSHILSQAPQPSVNIGSAWAFAFWGGDFWLFTSPGGFSSQVDRFQPLNGTTSTVVSDVGFNIVGAGVSTCAPVTPPS